MCHKTKTSSSSNHSDKFQIGLGRYVHGMQYSQTYDELQSSSNNLIHLQYQILKPKSINVVPIIDDTDNSFTFNEVENIPGKHLY